MDPRTLRKIIKSIESDPLRSHAVTRIDGYRYVISYNESTDIVTAEPIGRHWDQAGYNASTLHKLDSDYYRNGGEVFKKAVEWCHEVLNEIKKLRRGGKIDE